MAADLSWFFSPPAEPAAPKVSVVYAAASSGDAAALEEALSKGEADNVVNGWSAVHVSAAKGYAGCLTVLAAGRGDDTLWVPSASGESPLALAAGRGHEEATRILASSLLARRSFAASAAAAGTVAAAREAGAGELALACAAHGGHLGVVAYLVESGAADPSLAPPSGLTPLLVAAAASRDRVVAYLAAFRDGALLGATSDAGQTVLHKAAASGCLRTLGEVLGSRLVAVDARTDAESGGATALHLAAGRGRRGAVEALLAHGADVRGPTAFGQTALHKACFEGHDDVAALLLAHKADPAAVDHSGYTPLHCAAAGEETHGFFFLSGQRPTAGAAKSLWRACGRARISLRCSARCTLNPAPL